MHIYKPSLATSVTWCYTWLLCLGEYKMSSASFRLNQGVFTNITCSVLFYTQARTSCTYSLSGNIFLPVHSYSEVRDSLIYSPINKLNKSNNPQQWFPEKSSNNSVKLKNVIAMLTQNAMHPLPYFWSHSIIKHGFASEVHFIKMQYPTDVNPQFCWINKNNAKVLVFNISKCWHTALLRYYYYYY